MSSFRRDGSVEMQLWPFAASFPYCTPIWGQNSLSHAVRNKSLRMPLNFPLGVPLLTTCPNEICANVGYFLLTSSLSTKYCANKLGNCKHDYEWLLVNARVFAVTNRLQNVALMTCTRCHRQMRRKKTPRSKIGTKTVTDSHQQVFKDAAIKRQQR